MDSKTVTGMAQNLAGKVQDKVGDLTGDTGTQLAGKARQIGGKAQEVYGQATEQLRGTTTENPLATLAVVGLAAFALGVIVAKSGSDRY